jgi:hypothetical protein
MIEQMALELVEIRLEERAGLGELHAPLRDGFVSIEV